MRPNARATVYGVPIETNERGFRAVRPYTIEKPEGVVRIAALGDSFTVSAGVPFAEIMTTRLERFISAGFPRCQVEVYNFAVAGYGILHYVATLEEVVLEHRPDLVLLFIYPYNDLDIEQYDKEVEYIEEHATGNDPIPLPPAQRSWFASLHTSRLLLSHAQIVARKVGFLDQFVPELRYDRTVRAYQSPSGRRGRGLEALRRIQRLVATAGMPVHVFLMPMNDKSYDQQRPLFIAAAQLVAEAGVPVFSLLEGFAATGRPEEYRVNSFDSHPNTAYNSLASELVFQELDESGLLKGLFPATEDGWGLTPCGAVRLPVAN